MEEQAGKPIHLRQEDKRLVRILREATEQLWKDLEVQFFSSKLAADRRTYRRFGRRIVNEERMRAHLYHLLLMKGVSPKDILFETTIHQQIGGHEFARVNRRADLTLRGTMNNVFVELKVANAIGLTPSWTDSLRTGSEKKLMRELKKQLTDLAYTATERIAWAVFIVLLFQAETVPNWIRDFCELHKIELLYHCVN